MNSKGGTIGKGANKIDVGGLGATFSPKGSTVVKALIQTLSLPISLVFSGAFNRLGHQKGCGVIGESVYRGMSEASQLTHF